MLAIHQMDTINTEAMQEFHDADDIDTEDEHDDYHTDDELPFDISAEEPDVDTSVDDSGDSSKFI